VSAVVTAIIALAKAVPAIRDILERVFDEWARYQVNQATIKFNIKEKQRAHIQRKIREAKSDEERIVFSTLLNDINHRL
jgi:hypothetical protein